MTHLTAFDCENILLWRHAARTLWNFRLTAKIGRKNSSAPAAALGNTARRASMATKPAPGWYELARCTPALGMGNHTRHNKRTIQQSRNRTQKRTDNTSHMNSDTGRPPSPPPPSLCSRTASFPTIRQQTKKMRKKKRKTSPIPGFTYARALIHAGWIAMRGAVPSKRPWCSRQAKDLCMSLAKDHKKINER